MKEVTKLTLIGMLVYYFFMSQFQEAFQLPSSAMYLFVVLLIGGIVLVLVCPFLNFLTIKCNFITFLLMGAILLSAATYVMKLFMIDFTINEFVFSEMKLGTIQINEFLVSPLISICATSFLTSFLVSIYKELDKR
ncbi:MAG TPA: hypothetical protein PLG47_01180 [Candidatus Dojkabacteria bacterium]|nr:hypothetical protein [Candidatus Dojkabacteria bacterium]